MLLSVTLVPCSVSLRLVELSRGDVKTDFADVGYANALMHSVTAGHRYMPFTTTTATVPTTDMYRLLLTFSH